jgi:hypothetical protein
VESLLFSTAAEDEMRVLEVLSATSFHSSCPSPERPQLKNAMAIPSTEIIFVVCMVWLFSFYCLRKFLFLYFAKTA